MEIMNKIKKLFKNTFNIIEKYGFKDYLFYRISKNSF